MRRGVWKSQISLVSHPSVTFPCELLLVDDKEGESLFGHDGPD
jgi:hypothetical protein